ncbi:hypothetical protein [uncultured Winogradskyella sp.]|uniref:hypothetical protein n=1 Tax=uncultured Winogradskyella sp. TaxID=395353 RepID=UPI00261D341E|nr:hypothetical protein [uncultured Winogradskyella sp.]
MKKNKNLILIAIILIGILSFYGFKNYAEKVKDKHCLATQISSRIFDFNTFELKVDSTLNISDFKVVNQNSGKTIFEKGKSRKGIKNEYGYCTFELFWKGKAVYEFGHFKMNNWYTNKYELNIGMENNELKPSLEIYGPDSKKVDLYFKINK